jgi:acetyl esterase/lipase
VTMVDVFSGVAGTALWATKSIQKRRIVAPPPALTHCNSANDHVRTTVEYANGQKLDIWQPKASGPAPVLLYIPGGGWMFGHRRGQGYALLSQLVDDGWICVAIDYRTSPQHRWPAHYIDVQEAFWWIATNIEDYGGDPEGCLAVAGASAGGHMAALAGLAWDHKSLAGRDLGIRPDAVVSLYGVYDWTYRGNLFHDGFVRILESVVVGKRQATHPEIFTDASPITHVRADAPPFLIIQGERDWLTPAQGALRFYKELSEVSESEVEYRGFPEAGHAFDLTNQTATRSAVAEVSEFLAGVRNKRLVAA